MVLRKEDGQGTVDDKYGREYERKKEFLRQYGYATKRMLAAECEYMEYAYSLLGRGITYDAMPHGSGPSGDMAEVIAKKMELEKKMLDGIKRIDEVRTVIRKKIESLPSEEEKLVLTIKYMNLDIVRGRDGLQAVGCKWKGWADVAKACSYTERHARRICATAISRLSITQEEYEAVGIGLTAETPDIDEKFG